MPKPLETGTSDLATAPSSPPRGTGEWLRGRFGGIDLYDGWPIAVIVVVIVISTIHSPEYLTLSNFENILSQVSPLGIITMGQAVLLISGGLDLSVGYNIAMSSIITGLLLGQGQPLWIAVLAGVGSATLVGFINGVLAAQNRAHPFIITLGMSLLLFGLDTQLTGGNPVSDMAGLYTVFGSSLPGGIPMVAVPFILVVVLTFCFLRWTPLGRRAYAIGGNEEATYLSGIRVKRTKVYLYTIMGLLVGITGMVLGGEINSASFNIAQNYELQSIATAVIGGTALFGGRGGAFRSLQGVALYGIVQNAISFAGFSSNVQQMALGVIIVIAVMVSRRA